MSVFLISLKKMITKINFCYYLKGRSIYTHYYCGLREYGKKIFPTHLAILAAIDFGINEKLQALDLMGAGTPDKKYGVRDYKLEFGGALVEYGRFVMVNNILLYKLGIFALKAKKLIKQ